MTVQTYTTIDYAGSTAVCNNHGVEFDNVLLIRVNDKVNDMVHN